jgi:hypothetical protein
MSDSVAKMQLWGDQAPLNMTLTNPLVVNGAVLPQTTPTPTALTNTAPYTIRTDTVAHCAADAQAAINALAVDLAATKADLAAAVAALKTATVFD